MSKPARLREALRPHGALAPDCPECVYFDRCGGFEPEPSLFSQDCFAATCCKSASDDPAPTDCGLVCPHNPRFLELVRDVGGFGTDHLPPLTQGAVTLPRYLPLVHHPYRRGQPLDWPAVALDTYQVFKLRGDRFAAVADDSDGLRRAFGLAPGTRVVLRGVGSDPCLERYWEYRRRDAAAEQMARLGVSLAVGPNFSHFLDVPGTERLANRKRQLVCLDEMMRAGLSPVPHLNAVQPAEWRFWRDFLAGCPAVSVVAVEFETGNKNRSEGRRVLDRLAWLRDEIGRPLTPLLIGGTQFVEYVARRFPDAAFIDSTPFAKAVHRQAFDASADHSPWVASPTHAGEGVEHILARNVVGYAGWIDRRWEAGVAARPATESPSGRVALPTCPT